MGEKQDILGASVRHLDTQVVATVISVSRFLRGTKDRIELQWLRNDGGVQEMWCFESDVEVVEYATQPAPEPGEIPA